MSAVKSLNSNYTITNKATSLANVIISTHTMFVDGNLLVGGNTTQVTKTELSISDNTITVNKGEAGAGVSLGTAGIEVDRGSAANVSILWNETYDRWSLTTDGTTFANISTSTGAGTISVVGDPAPQLGGNLDVLTQSIFSSTANYVRFADNVAINVTSVVPSALTGNTVISAQTPGLGQSGLFVTTTSYTNQELITKSKAVWYSLIM
jgi:hypothetical protein